MDNPINIVIIKDYNKSYNESTILLLQKAKQAKVKINALTEGINKDKRQNAIQ